MNRVRVGMTTPTIEPFTIHVSDAALDDLRERLLRTRWPDSIGTPWEYGTDLSYLKTLVDYWATSYDWRVQERRLNGLPQFRIDIDGSRVHCVHVRGNGPAPFPLVITHGWPGSFVEMYDIVPRLADPASFGGDPADAFDVVVPSLPGYGFSDAAREPGMDPDAIADLWAQLMSALGYERFGAQGGDWGAAVSTQLAIGYPGRVAGVHLNYIMRAHLERMPLEESSDEERAFFERAKRWTADEGGYAHLQGTKPQTPAYALNDSPAGLAGYILEKFRSWSDCDGDVEGAFGKDALLTNVALYWHTQSIASSMRLYRERNRGRLRLPDGELPVPFGYAAFPRELAIPPKSLLERIVRLERYTLMERGGHFAAWEQPAALAAEIADFFRPLRAAHASP